MYKAKCCKKYAFLPYSYTIQKEGFNPYNNQAKQTLVK